MVLWPWDPSGKCHHIGDRNTIYQLLSYIIHVDTLPGCETPFFVQAGLIFNIYLFIFNVYPRQTPTQTQSDKLAFPFVGWVQTQAKSADVTESTKLKKKETSWLLQWGSVKRIYRKQREVNVQYPHDFYMPKIEMFVSSFLRAWLPNNRLPSLLLCPPSPSSHLLSVLTYLCSSFLHFSTFCVRSVWDCEMPLLKSNQKNLELCSILFFFCVQKKFREQLQMQLLCFCVSYKKYKYGPGAYKYGNYFFEPNFFSILSLQPEQFCEFRGFWYESLVHVCRSWYWMLRTHGYVWRGWRRPQSTLSISRLPEVSTPVL